MRVVLGVQRKEGKEGERERRVEGKRRRGEFNLPISTPPSRSYDILAQNQENVPQLEKYLASKELEFTNVLSIHSRFERLLSN